LAQLARLIGDPARAAMLVSLMDGRALTAGELARVSGVQPSTASGHLSTLVDGGLLALTSQGRHRYYRVAAPAIGSMMEIMMGTSALTTRPDRIVTGPRDGALRQARTCYDHLAGSVAVTIADSMVKRGQMELSADAALVTTAGLEFLKSLQVDLDGLGGDRADCSSPLFCRPCLDWSERRPHIGGGLGGRSTRRCWRIAGFGSRTALGRLSSPLPVGRRSTRTSESPCRATSRGSAGTTLKVRLQAASTQL
jgi:DNA-binding transcriptional ArsR family regulator